MKLILNFGVKINDISYTKHVEDLDITSEAGMIWQTASFTLALDADVRPPQKLEDVYIGYGDTIFAGFVHNIEKNSENEYSIECRAYTAKLDAPYMQPTHEILPVVNARELFDYIYTETGIRVYFRHPEILENVIFGGGYEIDGTYADAVRNVAEIVGMNYFSAIDTVVLFYAFHQNFEGHIVPVSEQEIISVEASEISESDGVGIVYIGTEDSSTLSRKCDILLNPDTGTTLFTISPVIQPQEESLFEFRGLVDTPEEIVLEDTYISAIDGTRIELKGDVVEVLSISVDDTHLSEDMYHIEYRVLTLNKPAYGVINVWYTYEAYRGHAQIIESGGDLYADIQVKYHDTFLCRNFGIVKPTARQQKIRVVDPKQNNTVCRAGYSAVFEFYADVANPNYRINVYMLDGHISHRTTSDCWRVFSDKLPIERTNTGDIIVRLQYAVEEIQSLKYLTMDIPYTQNGDILILDNTAAGLDWVTITYKLAGQKTSIYTQGVKSMKVLRDGKEVYSADLTQYSGAGGWHYEHPDACGCTKPLKITHNIFQLLGVNAPSGYGFCNIKIVYPNGGTYTKTTEANGDFTFTAQTAGIYEIKSNGDPNLPADVTAEIEYNPKE